MIIPLCERLRYPAGLFSNFPVKFYPKLSNVAYLSLSRLSSSQAASTFLFISKTGFLLFSESTFVPFNFQIFSIFLESVWKNSGGIYTFSLGFRIYYFIRAPKIDFLLHRFEQWRTGALKTLSKYDAPFQPKTVIKWFF